MNSKNRTQTSAAKDPPSPREIKRKKAAQHSEKFYRNKTRVTRLQDPRRGVLAIGIAAEKEGPLSLLPCP